MIHDTQTAVDEPVLFVLSGWLFPPPVVVAKLLGQAPANVLTLAEEEFISGCSAKRIDDFARGRACVHRGLSELGLPKVSVLSGAQREPLWPAGIVGSVTHTTGFAAAVVARQLEIESVGIDCEVIESVTSDLWDRICTLAERDRLAELPEARAQQVGALTFAAKEAFYKCQFPISRQWVGFEDVAIEISDDGTFLIRPQVRLPVADDWVAALVGRYEYRGPWVVTGVSALICARV